MATFGARDTDVHDSVGGRDDGMLLYESSNTRIVRRLVIQPEGIPGSRDPDDRARIAAESVIWKEPLGPGAADRMRHEIAILGSLTGVAGVAHLVQVGDAQKPGFAVEDVGGVSLAMRPAGSPVPGVGAQSCSEVKDLITFALALARVLAGVHQAGVVHKDINPANILIVESDRRPVLIDWDLATTFTEERPGFTHESSIVGTLAYLAPEQSGRTGRGVDQRADLYAVGATLYEIAVGRPPFGNGDAMAMIHDHLARVPQPPNEVNPALPVLLSDIILRLLEKEPDRRYQSAQGLAHDLARLLATFDEDDTSELGNARFALGEQDFSIRICAPSQLVGRESEIGALSAALDLAVAGQRRGLLVSGASGVGKSALIDELRSMVTEHNGWFVQGKFDQYRQTESSDAFTQAMQALARLLLAEPDEQLAVFRERIVEIVGPDTDILAMMQPEYGVLLGVAPARIDGADPQQLGARLFRAGLGVLRALSSPERPLVIVVDDLQWAGPFPISFLDAILMDQSLSGLLVVGAYRDSEVDEAHPFSAALARWERLGVNPTRLRLENLAPAGLSTLLAQMLRLSPDRALDLTEAVSAHTQGNPYDTVELVNALRHEGVLSLGDTGWQWDAATVRRFVGQGDVVDLLTARIDALPADAASLLEVLACLGGDVNLDLLAVAADLDLTATTEALTPALEDGLLVMIHEGAPAVRFRHDRVQQAATARPGTHRRQALHLQLARRLAMHPALAASAAELYLAAPQEAIEVGERLQVAQLFRTAAGYTRLLNMTQCARFLTSALALLQVPGVKEPSPDTPEHGLITQLLIEQHAALFNLARLEEANEVYGQIERRTTDSVMLAGAAAVQIAGLTNKNRSSEAMSLGIDLLTRLEFEPPALEAIPAAMGLGLDLLYRWVAQGPQPEELTRPEISDPRILAAVRLLERLAPAAFATNHPLLPWLNLQAHHIWVEHGPCAALVGALGGLPILGIAISQDYTVGYQAGQRLLRVSQAHGYEPATSQLRNTLATFATPWFEPIEQVTAQARAAREGLMRYGELQYASYSYTNTLEAMLNSAATIDLCQAEYTSAVTFWSRRGDEGIAKFFTSYGQLLKCLIGETNAPGSFDDGTFDETDHLDSLSEFPLGIINFHNRKALAIMLSGDTRELAKHTAESMRLLALFPGMYFSALPHLLRGLALTAQMTTAGPNQRADLLAEFDALHAWLAARAADAPANFLHLVRWLDAERAWAIDDFGTALHGFEAAMCAVGQHQRPWHAALITERAGRFHLAHHLDETGLMLLARARNGYHIWGATAKVKELDREFPHLTTRSPAHTAPTSSSTGAVRSTVASAESIDLMAVLQASQALSSETNLERLRTRVVEVLTTMTGATSVQLLLWNQDAQAWSLTVPNDLTGETILSVDDASRQGLICLSAFRYAERTLQPLLITDATRDDRFARDPYLDGLDNCSLLVIPVLSRGLPRAMLLMENRLSHGNFTAERLDAVLLIAGQLAVCLDNALAERFRSLVQRSSDLTLVCDRTGAISYASAASTEILGITDTHLTGHPIRDLIHPDDHDAFTTWITHDGLTGQMLECRLQPAGTRSRWVEVSCTDLTADPAVAALVLHLRDVTERRALESELRHAQKLESVGQLAAGIAHEINTPIQFIAANLQFLAESLTPITDLLDGYRDTLADSTLTSDLTTRYQALLAQEAGVDLEFLREEIPMAATQAIEGTQRVARIVRAMKAFAHPGGDGKTKADLNEAIRNTLIVADSEINPVADVVLDLAVDLPPVLCNLGDINQAVLNLVVNAAHAITDAVTAGRGRGTLTIRTYTETTATATDPDNADPDNADPGSVIIEIQDTGTGIPADIADRVFDQFFTTKAVGVGTGQGLALVHTLIHDRHHGTITFTTEPGVGTTFIIRLPNHRQRLIT
jgi:PAS domain S-box-containing protein